MSKQMSVKKDLKCVFNMPKQLSSQFDSNGEEYHGLPPYAPMDVYPVDEYEACPTNWMHGSDVASSYFVGVKEDHGMWLDFNECFYHTYDVAVVISVQGINPITGQKMVAEKALQLEQYYKKCPIHDVNFKQDRYCEKCGFKWPGQNYLATTGTPEMMMWLDGFRTLKGKVRQYIFTEDKIRGVASQLIGEDRVFAIGIAYYLSKDKKPYILQRPEEGSVSDHNGVHTGACVMNYNSSISSPLHTSQNWNIAKTKGGTDSLNRLISSKVDDDKLMMTMGESAGLDSDGLDDQSQHAMDVDSLDDITALAEAMTEPIRRSVEYKKASSVQSIVPVKKFEIGAGALIKQRIYDDPKMMSYWESEPAGMIYINYCDEETKKKILDGGRRADEKDGFLQGSKVGG